MKKKILFAVFLTVLLSFSIPLVNRYEKVLFSENGYEKVYFYNGKDKYYRLFDMLSISRKTENTFSVDSMGRKRIYMTNPDGSARYRLVQDSKVKYTEPKKIAILYIATGRYIQFWDDFYKSMEKHFLKRHDKTYFLFTNHDDLDVPKNVVKVHQDQLPWPYITFKRYHFFEKIEEQLKDFDYIYFLNGTMRVVDDINEDIFPTDEQGIMVTMHPGYFNSARRHRPYDRNPKSKAYISEQEGEYYVMGGFNGGTSKGFLKLIKTIREWSDIDMENKVMPAWHDESMLNRYLVTYMNEGKNPLVLLPEYAIPQTGHSMVDELRLYKKMLILDKGMYGGHGWLRSLDK